MKKIFVLGMLVGFFLLGSSVFAWQNPCILQGYDFIMSESYVLMDFTDNNDGFGPRPDCAGEVTILCPDDRECVLPYGVWGDILIIGENIYDMSFKLIDDDRLVPQNDANWEDVLARNGCAASEPPVCDSNHLNLCEDQTACEEAMGYWCEEACQAEECSPDCPECPDCPDCDNATCPECPPCDNATNTEPFVCPLVGNAYRFDVPEMSYSISNFKCEVGPGCIGTCDFTYGNFDTGPMYIDPLPFSCQVDSITIAGLPCDFQGEDLRCLGVDIKNYYHYLIGNVTYCFQEEKSVVIFKID